MDKPVIPGYEVVEQIAEGGMATVWKARQISLDRLVALKILTSTGPQNEDDIERFRAEAQAAAKVRHRALCEIYDAGEENGLVYYAMEYVAGFSVGRLLERKGDLPEKQALLIAAGVANVLGDIWTKHHVIHCDIKPDNILIDQDGVIRVTDLGLARIIGRMTQRNDGDIVGTPNYMSPEQARGGDDLDCRTDIYGLGATLYHMLTGLMPFADTAGTEAVDRQRTDYIADPQSINPAISNEVACLVEKMMVKDRNARYAAWEEVVRDLEEVRAGRLPRGEVLPAGQSTVARTEERAAATEKQFKEMKPKMAANATGPSGKRVAPAHAGKKTIKRSSGKRAAPVRRSPPVTAGGGGTSASMSTPAFESGGIVAKKTLVLLCIVGGAYALSFFIIDRLHQTHRSAARERAPAETETTVSARPDPSREPDPAVIPPPPSRQEEAAQPEPTPAEPESAPETADRQSSEAWDHPDYVEAMRLLREADSVFQRFLEERNQALLADIEPACRRAISLLEGVRSEAPREARIAERIRQSYQLISNSRQARVLAQ